MPRTLIDPITRKRVRVKPIRVQCGGYRKTHKTDRAPVHDTQLAGAAAESGGVLLYVKLAAPLGLNGGCGSPTYVEGTNGGQMPCGSLLTRFGETAPYYCALCKPGPTRKT